MNTKTIDEFDVLERDGALTLRRPGDLLPGGSVRLATVVAREDKTMAIRLAYTPLDTPWTNPPPRDATARLVARALRGIDPAALALGWRDCFTGPGCRACGGTGLGAGYRREVSTNYPLGSEPPQITSYERRRCSACGGRGGDKVPRLFHCWLDSPERHAAEYLERVDDQA